MDDNQEWIAVIDTDKVAFRGNYETDKQALRSVRSLRNNFYMLTDPMCLVKYETFSMKDLATLLRQFETDTSDKVLRDRATLVSRLWRHWQDYGLRAYRKNAR